MKVVMVFEAEWQRDYVPVPWATWAAFDGWAGGNAVQKSGCPWQRGYIAE